jgi:hypothetical protein
MPKRIILGIAFAAIATFAACSSPDVNDLYGVATATPGPTATPYVNPSASAAIVYVFSSASPVPSQTVYLYDSSSAQQIIGSVIATKVTNSAGTATFGNLTPTHWYCFQTSYNATPGAIAPTQTLCNNWWGDSAGVIFEF